VSLRQVILTANQAQNVDGKSIVMDTYGLVAARCLVKQRAVFLGGY
jgi:hypothetical protein